MALILPISQEFYELNAPGLVVGMSTLRLVSASDTFTVPGLADTASGVSVKQLERANDPTVTVTSSGFTVTLAGGTAGDTVLIVHLHQGRRDYNPEE